MKKIIVLFLLVANTTAFCQRFNKAKIYFADGKVMEGFIDIPKNPYDKTIEFKKNENDKKTTLSSDQLKSLVFSIDDSTQYEFVWEVTKKPVTKTKYKMQDPAWLSVLVKGPATLYAAGQSYKVTKKGQLIIRGSWSGGMPPDTHFFLKRDGEENPVWVAFYSPSTVALDFTFRYWTERYFADYPELVKRIHNKEFKVLQIAEVVNAYNSWKRKAK